MADELARGVIKVEVDASDVKTGMAEAKAAVKDFEQATTSAGANAGASMQQGAAAVAAGTQQMDSSTRRWLRTLELQTARMTMTKSEYTAWRAAQMNVTNEAAPFVQRLREAEKVTVSYGNSVRQTAQAMRMLPAQITDIVTGLASGQPAYMVAIQQGGQLKDSFGGIGAAGRALLTIFTPLRIAIGGVAGVAALIGAAFSSGASESRRFADSIALTGNYASTTVSDLTEMAQRVDQVIGTQRDAAEVLARLVDGAQLTSRSFEQITTAVVAMNRATGRDVDDLVEEFEKLAKKPGDAIVELNEKYRHLSFTTYEQIRALEDQKRTEDAVALAIKTHAEALESRAREVEQNAGVMERAWRALKTTVLEAWDAMLNVGRRQTLSEQIREQQAVVERLEADLIRQQSTGSGQASNATIDALVQEQARLEALLESQREMNKLVDRQGAIQQDNQRRIAAAEEARGKKDKGGSSTLSEAQRYLESLQKQTEQLAELTKYEQALYDIQMGRLKGITPEIERQIVAEAKALDLSKQAIEDAKDRAKILEDLTKDQEKREEAARKLRKELEDQASAWLDMADPMRQFIRDLEEIDQLVEKGFLNERQANQIKDAISDKNKGTADDISEYAKNAAKGMQGAFADFLFDPFKDGLAGMLTNFANVIQRMVAEAAAAQLFRYLLGDSFAKTGNITGALGGLFGGNRAIGGPVAAGVPYIVGENGPERFVPSASGQIVPGVGGAPLVQHITINAGNSAAAGDPHRLANLLGDVALARVREATRRGG